MTTPPEKRNPVPKTIAPVGKKAAPRSPAASPARPAVEPEAFDLENLAETYRASGSGRKRKNKPGWPAVAVTGGILVGGGILVVAVVWIAWRSKSVSLMAIPDQQVKQQATLRLTVAAEHPNVPAAQLRFALRDAPRNASIDPKSGQFTWKPGLEVPPGKYRVNARATVEGSDTLSDERPFTVRVIETIVPPLLAPIEEKTVREGETLELSIQAKDPNTPPRPLIYGLLGDVPAGAAIDARSGQFHWTPGDGEGGKTFHFEVRVEKNGAAAAVASQTLAIRVEYPATRRTIQGLAGAFQSQGSKVVLLGSAVKPSAASQSQLLAVDGQRLMALEYETPAAAADQSQDVAPAVLQSWGIPATRKVLLQVFRSDRLIVFYAGGDAKTAAFLREHLGAPSTVEVAPAVAATPAPAAASDTASDEQSASGPKRKAAGKKKEPGAAGSEEDAIVALYDSRRMLSPSEYPRLRSLCAARFEKQRAAAIKHAYGSDYDAMTQWFAAHPDIKEEFYMALDPEHDKIPAALALFRDICKQFPQKIQPYANLAIAVAVTWDDAHSIYDYAHHQVRVHGRMPTGAVGALDNFQYFVNAERVMQGRIQLLPWEFLIYLVNHRTPLVERQWALTNYLARRTMIGKCYSDVPYDYGMLRSESKDCLLGNKDYTLANIRQFGGVCSMQADFAARVANSLGVPAAYVGGESTSADHHAWVMWVELAAVTKYGIAFSLQSEGRYRIDKFYVGHLRDPQTGQQITDRDLELRLHTVGVNAQAKRQAVLAMRVFPLIRDRKQWQVGEQLVYLGQVTRLCPYNEDAWTALAGISKQGGIGKQRLKQMVLNIDSFFRTFAAFPDFTWKIFDDLIAFQDVPKQRNKYYERLVGLYEQAGRPDLACEARLKFTDYLVQQKHGNDAVEGLAASIKKFPGEGRYVPKMLDKLEALCQGNNARQEQLLLFYKQFLPLVPRMRGDEPSKYCIDVYGRAIDRFKKGGQPQFAQILELQLAQLTPKKTGSN